MDKFRPARRYKLSPTPLAPEMMEAFFMHACMAACLREKESKEPWNQFRAVTKDAFGSESMQRATD
jgi:hypothetical protein